MSGATANLPSLEGVSSTGSTAAGALSGFLDLVGSLRGGSGGASPVASVSAALSGLGEHLDVDVSGLSERLPQAISTIQNALPEGSLQFVEEIEQSYQQVMEFLQNSEVVKQISAGSDLEQTALALIDDVLELFQGRLGELAANLIGAEELTRVRAALQLIEDLRSNYAAHAGELGPFLSNNLLGVAPDLLSGVTAHVSGVLQVLAPLSDAQLDVQVMPARSAMAAAAAELLPAIRGFDPSDGAQYVELNGKLQSLDTTLDAGLDVLLTFYQALETVVDSHAWDAIFTTYADLLRALPLQQIPTVDDAIEQIAGVLDDFLARVTMTFSPEDLARRVTALSSRIQDAFTQSPLGQARQIIVDFIDRIRQAIEQVPTEAVQQAVEQMLGRIRQELDGLGLSQVRASIAEAFEEAQQFIDDNLNGGLVDQVNQSLGSLLAQLQDIPIADIGQQLTEAVASAGQVVQDLETQLADGLEHIRELLSQLDSVSFRPVADEVIEEIQTLKSKLQSISPQSLSDAEKLAIQGGLAILRAIDLEGMVNAQLKTGFAAISDELTNLIQQIIAAWEDFRRRIGDFDPETVLGPLSSLLEQITGGMQSLSGATLLAPLYALLDELTQKLATLSPGALLAPLQQPYQQMMAVVERVNPDVWVEPLRQLFAQIDELIGVIDITPLLDTLEAKEKELFAQAQQTIIGALDSVQLPAPLDGFYDRLKVVALLLTDTVFGDPAESARKLNLELENGMSLSTLFVPLDLAFDQLVTMLDGVPQNDLVAVLEGLRGGLGTGLRAIDPRGLLQQLRAGQGKLSALSPVAVLPALPALIGVRPLLAERLALAPPEQASAATALLAQFDLVVAPLQPAPGSRLQQLQVAHTRLVNALRGKLNALSATGAEAAYTELDQNLGRLLPAFLRQSEPLTMSSIRAGLAELRPSHKARRLDESLARFLGQLAPLQNSIEPAMNGFFQMIKESILLIHPAAIKGSVQAVYDTLRSKVHILDPEQLAGALKADVYEPLIDPLLAIDPAAIAAQLDGLYQAVVTSVGSGVQALLDQIRQACDQVLGQVRAAVTGVLNGLRAQVAAILEQLDALIDQLDALIVNDLFGRLLRTVDNLETSFNSELDRVQNEFDAMLGAIPLGSGSGGAAALG